MAEYVYRAFLSYSWADNRWAAWFHRALESYDPPPAALAGLDARKTSLKPIFRDREEEAANPKIGATIEKALEASEFLIVICSPTAAQSKWVNREVAYFKQHRDPEKVLAIIVDGEPGHRDEECFPPALTHRVTEDYSLGEPHRDHPLAADARKSGDGKRIAMLKLVAAMLGLRLDNLVRRDERRRKQRRQIAIGVAAAVALAVGTTSWLALDARNEVSAERAEAAELIEFMLSNARDEYVAEGELEQIERLGERALEYYRDQDLSRLDAESLARRARALHVIGETRTNRGAMAEALEIFQGAYETTEELLQRDPNNEQRIFDHAQSAFWVGYAAFNNGDLVTATARLDSYLVLAMQLVAIDPDNPDWQREVAYGYNGVGYLALRRGQLDEAVRALSETEARFGQLARSPAGTEQDWLEHANLKTTLAQAEMLRGRYDEAKTYTVDAITVLDIVFEHEQDHALARSMLGTNLSYRGEIELDQGDFEAALDWLQQAVEVDVLLVAQDPANQDWAVRLQRARIRLAEVLLAMKSPVAESHRRETLEQLQALVTEHPNNYPWMLDQYRVELLPSLFAGPIEGLTLAQAQTAVSELEQLRGRTPQYADFRNQLIWARFAEARLQQQAGNTSAARVGWNAVLESVDETGTANPQLLAFRAIALARLGREDEAEALRRRLDRIGYRHPLLDLLETS